MFGPDTFKAHLFHDLSHTVYRQRFLNAAIDLFKDGGSIDPCTGVVGVGQGVVLRDELFLDGRRLELLVTLVQVDDLFAREPVTEGRAIEEEGLRVELHIVDM